MDNQQLNALFIEVQRQHTNSLKRLNVQFHSFRRPKHTIEWTAWRIHIKVSDYFQDAPHHILKCLAVILLARVYRLRVHTAIRSEYNRYLDEIIKRLPPQKFRNLDRYQAVGKFYNLNDIFNHINLRMFDNTLQKPVLGWSLKKSYTRLGFYDETRNLLVISRIFDSAKVPLKVVEYLMYHEMLHIQIPSVIKNEKRIVHSAAFKRQEREFPEYEYIQKWIKKYRTRL